MRRGCLPPSLGFLSPTLTCSLTLASEERGNEPKTSPKRTFCYRKLVLGSFWARFGLVLGSFWARFFLEKLDWRSILARSEVDLRSICAQLFLDYASRIYRGVLILLMIWACSWPSETRLKSQKMLQMGVMGLGRPAGVQPVRARRLEQARGAPFIFQTNSSISGLRTVTLCTLQKILSYRKSPSLIRGGVPKIRKNRELPTLFSRPLF